MNVLYYLRGSKCTQIITIDVQRGLCDNWMKHFAPEGAKHIGELVDAGVTSKIDLFKRPQGQHILTELQRGDILVVAKLTRAFRSTFDALESMRVLNELGIRLVMLDLNIDMGTPTGKLMFTVLAAIAEFERELLAERIREALAQRASEGQWLGNAPVGWIIKTRQQTRAKNNRLVPDYHLREIAKHLTQRIVDGESLESVTVSISIELTKKGDRKKWLMPNTVLAWCVYYILDWPPLSRKRVIELVGEDPFTCEWIRANYAEVAASLAGTP